MSMKKIIISLLSLLLPYAFMAAQEATGEGRFIQVDSVIYRPAAALDASLEGKSIFSLLSSQVPGATVSQDAAVASAMTSHISSNRRKKLSGYRIRIYFDNKQNSRGASEAAARRFQGAFPGIATYRTFTSPFFKVAVGDFRTRSEAAYMLSRVKGMFPSAFIIKENINYPVVDREHSYVTDTVKVYRPAPSAE